jgi:sodium/potassium/calcium exchanger 3/sodium/potassium/calcium exchanger 4
VLQDGYVSQFESLVLFAGCIIFAVTVAFTAKACTMMGWDEALEDEVEAAEDDLTGDEVCVELDTTRMQAAKDHWKVTVDEHGLYMSEAPPSAAKRQSVRRRTLMGVGSMARRETLSGHDPGNMSNIDFDHIKQAVDVDDKTIDIKVTNDVGTEMSMKLHFADKTKKKTFIQNVEHSGHVAVTEEVDYGMSRVMNEASKSLSDKHLPIYMKVFCIISVPVELIIGATVGWCDVRVPAKRDLWAYTFCCSMIWLGIFSYVMCMAADGLHDGFGIPTGVLGVTLCAVGTSFPNFWASVLMAKAGRADMAVANALGSNVQNVFLALAIPWICKTFSDGKPYQVASNGIMTGVAWMGGTEIFVFVCAVFGGFAFSKPVGFACIVLYFAYVIVAIGLV